MTNFDKKPNRWNYYERKADMQYNLDHYGIKDKALNFGIADINYQSPQPIIDAIKARADKGTYSYSYTPDTTLFAIYDWYKNHHNLIINKNWIKVVHGTVNAMHQIVQAFTNENDAVLIQTPIYRPFAEAIEQNNRVIVENKLTEFVNTYQINFIDFENQIKEHNIKLFMFCSPHNPGSVVWDTDTLNRVIKICQKYNVLIFSDEVHSDMTFKPFKSVLESNYDNIIIANSPNKVFNLGGLKASYLIIPNEEIHKKIDLQYQKNSTTSLNVFVNPAFQSAYLEPECANWMADLKSYIYSNYLYLQHELTMLGYQVFELESTYLLWVKLPFKANYLTKYLKENNIIICDYTDFYGANDHFIRINIATPKSDLQYLIEILQNFISLRIKK